MKSSTISSGELPEAPVSVKECVNLGHWILFKSEALKKISTGAVYFLKADSDIFGLDDRGKVIWHQETDGLNVEIDELLYFSDLMHPPSLSNANVA